MNDLTLLFLVMAIILYIISVIYRRSDFNWFSFFISICSIGAVLIDTELDSQMVILSIVPMFYIMLMSGVRAFGLTKE